MTLRILTLRPGYLVTYHTATGGNRYQITKLIEPERVLDSGETSEVKETDRRHRDKAEQEEAEEVRGRMRALIESTCIKAGFNLYCPTENYERFEERLSEADVLEAEFNARAKVTRIESSAAAVKIDGDNELALKEIRGDIRQTLDDVAALLKAPGLDEEGVKATRAALGKTKKLARLLEPSAQASIDGTVSMAREALTAIKKVGEAKAAQDTKRAITALEQQRLAFLDLDEDPPIEAPTPAISRIVEIPVEEPKKPSKKPRLGPSKEAA